MGAKTEWYKEAVVYQIYPLSYKDSNNDGIGDIQGIISGLDHIRELGATAIWFSPLYASPWKDYGYDISDYRAIHPAFGTMEDFDRLVCECRKRDLKVIMDMVVNHTSDQHPWFRAALADRNSPYRDYYIIRPGRRIDGDKSIIRNPSGLLGERISTGKAVPVNFLKQLRKDRGAATYSYDESGEDGLLPPTNWTSSFTGSAWQRIEGTDEFYLHLFAPEQPDLNWENPAVRDEIIDILKFWLDKGVDGFRFDVFNLYSKVYPLRDDDRRMEFQKGVQYFVDGPRMHEFLKEMNERALSLYDTYTVGESYQPDPEHAHRYIHEESGELDSIFDFEHLNSDNMLKFMPRPFSLRKFKRGLLDPQIRYHGTGWNTLVLENHDCVRSVSRFGIRTEFWRYEAATFLAMVTFLGWGTPFIYQGEEIGMTNTVFTGMDDLKDPVSHLVFGTMTEKLHIPKKAAFRLIAHGARDHARTPMQWDDSVNAGFNDGAEPWQTVNSDYKEINAARDKASRHSIYRFYQKLLEIRKSEPALIYGRTTEYEPGSNKLIVYSRTLTQDGADSWNMKHPAGPDNGEDTGAGASSGAGAHSDKRFLIAGNFTEDNVSFVIPADFELSELSVRLSNYNRHLDGRELILRPYEAVLFEETRK